MCIAIVCFPGCDAINLEIDLIFLIKLFFYMTKKLRQNFKYLENKGLSVARTASDIRVRL